MCLFVLVLLDQHVHANFRELHPAFQLRHRVPKFGWSGFGPHDENPFKLLIVPVERKIVSLADLTVLAGEAMAILLHESTELIRGQTVNSQVFFSRLRDDPGFDKYRYDPSCRAVTGELGELLAERAILARDEGGEVNP
jgi:hypothetical protein